MLRGIDAIETSFFTTVKKALTPFVQFSIFSNANSQNEAYLMKI